MRKFKIVLAYDGTHYGGWQVQPNSVSIQALVEKALSTLLKSKATLIASGRTDAGVHARAQTAHFNHHSPLDLAKLQLSLNGMLPKDIRICSVENAPADFHARYSASSKVYRYHLRLDKEPDPFKKLYQWHLHFPLSIPLLEKAAAYFVGEHDFSSFANQGDEGAAARDPVRILYRLDVMQEEGGVYLEFEGNGFLYKMVRNITGTLIDVCRGKIRPEEIPAIFAAKDRSKASAAAPPHGLFLVKVNYNAIVAKEENLEIPCSPLSLS